MGASDDRWHERLLSARDYEVGVDPEFPGDGMWTDPVFAFDRDGRSIDEPNTRWGAGLVIRTTTESTGPWIGMFAPGVGRAEGVFATASADLLCVVTAGSAALIEVRSPEAGPVIVSSQVQQVVDYSSIVALDATGVVWISQMLAADDLRVVIDDAEAIHCTGRLMAEGCTVGRISVDTTMGRIL